MGYNDRNEVAGSCAILVAAVALIWWGVHVVSVCMADTGWSVLTCLVVTGK